MISPRLAPCNARATFLLVEFSMKQRRQPRNITRVFRRSVRIHATGDGHADGNLCPDNSIFKL